MATPSSPRPRPATRTEDRTLSVRHRASRVARADYVTETLNQLAQRTLTPAPVVRLPFGRADAALGALETGQHVLFTER